MYSSMMIHTTVLHCMLFVSMISRIKLTSLIKILEIQESEDITAAARCCAAKLQELQGWNCRIPGITGNPGTRYHQSPTIVEV